MQIEHQDLLKIQEIRKNILDNLMKVAEINIQINDLSKLLIKLQNDEKELFSIYDRLIQDRDLILDELEKKYGYGDLNIETGEFTLKK